MLERQESDNPLAHLRPVTNGDTVLRFARAVRSLYAAPAVKRYALDLVTATRQHPGLRLGASPRASLQLLRAAKAVAAMSGRDHVLPDDVQYLAVPVLAHRLVITTETRLAGQDAQSVVSSIVAQTPIPARDSSERQPERR